MRGSLRAAWMPLAAIAAFTAPAADDGIAAAVERVQDGVVMVKGERGIATGWSVEEGFVLTSYGALAGSARLEVVRKGKDPAAAAPHAADPVRDLLLLKLASADSLPALAADSAHPFRSGEAVFLIGHPTLGGDILGWTAASGIVSNPSRKIGERSLIQTSAPVNPGNWGAPLFDAKGTVVGIVSSKAGGLERVAFALPVSEALDFLGKRETPAFRVKGSLADWEKARPETSAKPGRSEVVRIGLPSVADKLLWNVGRKRLLVLDSEQNAIHVVDVAAGSVEKSVVAGSEPADMDCVSGDDVVVADAGGLCLRWVDLGTGKTVSQISLPRNPVAVRALDARLAIAVLANGDVIWARKSGEVGLFRGADFEEELPTWDEVMQQSREGKISPQEANALREKIQKQSQKKPPPPMTDAGLAETSPGVIVVGQVRGDQLSFLRIEVKRYLKTHEELESAFQRFEKELEPEKKALEELKPKVDKTHVNLTSYNNRVERYNKQVEQHNARVEELIRQREGCLKRVAAPEAGMSGNPGEGAVHFLKGKGSGKLLCGRGIYGVQSLSKEGDLKRYPRGGERREEETGKGDPPAIPEAKKRQEAMERFLEGLANVLFVSADGRHAASGYRLYSTETLTSDLEWPFPISAGAFDQAGKTLFLASLVEPEVLAIDFEWLQKVSDR